MSTIFMAPGSAISARLSLSQWTKRLYVPIESWSPRRRWIVALVVALLVFALGARGWVVADLSGAEASRTALAHATQQLADAKHFVVQLPALRAQAAAMPARVAVSWTSADDVRIVSQLAAENSVTLLAVEPGGASGAGIESMRSMRLTARTDFVHLMAFMRGLADLPVLVVPTDVTVRREGTSLSLSASLRVFNALQPSPSIVSNLLADDALDPDDEEDVVFFDPFSLQQMQAADAVPVASPLRLIGLLRDTTHVLALLDTEEGATTVVAGQQIGFERVAHLDALGVTLANGSATRTLLLPEAS